jgi:hypothetical protein
MNLSHENGVLVVSWTRLDGKPDSLTLTVKNWKRSMYHVALITGDRRAMRIPEPAAKPFDR